MGTIGGFDTATGDRIYDPNDPAISAAFFEDLCATKAWKRFDRDFGATPENNQKVEQILGKLHQDAEFFTTGMVSDALNVAMDAGELTRKPVEPAPAVNPIPAPLRTDGQPMTASQQRWSEYRTFSESHSMKGCRERARTDAGYRSFMSKNLEREFEGVGDSVVPQNPHLVHTEDPSQAALKGIAAKAGLLVPQLLDWVKVYNSTASSQVRSLRSAASNPLGYEQYEKSLQAALTAGLI